VFFDGASSTSFPINIGVKQGCILSPLLFSAFLDFVMRQSLPELRRWGVKLEYARQAIAPIMNSKDGNAAAAAAFFRNTHTAVWTNSFAK